MSSVSHHNKRIKGTTGIFNVELNSIFNCLEALVHMLTACKAKKRTLGFCAECDNEVSSSGDGHTNCRDVHLINAVISGIEKEMN